MWEVENSAKAVESALRMDAASVRSSYNFIFLGAINGHRVKIFTRPVNIAQSRLEIMSVQVEKPE